eukprot:5763-Heterococcus_DN1.PRE.3
MRRRGAVQYCELILTPVSVRMSSWFLFYALYYRGHSFNPTAATSATAQNDAQQSNSISSCRESFAYTAAHNSATATATTAGTSDNSKLSAAAAAFGATAVTQRGVTESAVTAGAVRSSSFDHTTANSGSTNGVNSSSTSTNSSTGNCGYGGRRVSQNARARSESWPDQRVQGASSSGGIYSGSKLQHITEGQQQQQQQQQHIATVPRTMSCSDGLNRRISITGSNTCCEIAAISVTLDNFYCSKHRHLKARCNCQSYTAALCVTSL